MKPTDIREGMRVCLAAFEGEPEQTGTVIDASRDELACGVVIVSLDPNWVEPGDDGIREVPFDQLEAL